MSAADRHRVVTIAAPPDAPPTPDAASAPDPVVPTVDDDLLADLADVDAVPDVAAARKRGEL